MEGDARQPGMLSQVVQRDSPCHVMLCLVKKRYGGLGKVGLRLAGHQSASERW